MKARLFQIRQFSIPLSEMFSYTQSEHVKLDTGFVESPSSEILNAKIIETRTISTISVVIAWVNSFELLEFGLEKLFQSTRPADEIIIVTRHGESEQQKLREKFPNVRLIAEPSATPITKLRSRGIKNSNGTIVVITEDHCIPSEKWLETVEKRIKQGYSIVGGPVENTWEKRLRDSAAFLTEYSFAIKNAGETKRTNENAVIPGNNAAYSYELIGGLCRVLDRNLWESFYHNELRQEGKKMIYDSEMLLYHHRPFDFFYFISQRFHFCRSFAEMRSQSLDRAGRIKYGLGSAILPPLLWLRGLRTLIEKKRFVGRYFLCSPLIAFYLCAGAWGEMMGYFFGGGKSLARVE